MFFFLSYLETVLVTVDWMDDRVLVGEENDLFSGADGERVDGVLLVHLLAGMNTKHERGCTQNMNGDVHKT